IEQHPTIGRRILEGVHGFQDYLTTVELHHENWNGSGYPLGLRGDATPLSARIVHVADAYDAMTTDRPYRRGMSHAEAGRVIEENSGVQFDPNIVSVFTKLPGLGEGLFRTSTVAEPELRSMQNLTEAVNQIPFVPQPSAETKS